MRHVFVSYSRCDQDYADRLVAHLEAAGIDVWIDRGDIEPGARYRRSLEAAINACAAFLVVMTPAAKESNWIEDELDWAEQQDKPIFTLLLEGRPWFGLTATQYEDVSGGRLPSDLFVETLRAHVDAASVPVPGGPEPVAGPGPRPPATADSLPRVVARPVTEGAVVQRGVERNWMTVALVATGLVLAVAIAVVAAALGRDGAEVTTSDTTPPPAAATTSSESGSATVSTVAVAENPVTDQVPASTVVAVPAPGPTTGTVSAPRPVPTTPSTATTPSTVPSATTPTTTPKTLTTASSPRNDQVNDRNWAGQSSPILPDQHVVQVVVPSLRRLTGVQIALTTINAGRTGDTVTLTVSGPNGELAEVSQGFNAGFDGFFLFDMPGDDGVDVVPGEPLSLSLSDSGSGTFGWKYIEGNPYPPGAASIAGGPYSYDFMFRTVGQ